MGTRSSRGSARSPNSRTCKFTSFPLRIWSRTWLRQKHPASRITGLNQTPWQATTTWLQKLKRFSFPRPGLPDCQQLMRSKEERERRCRGVSAPDVPAPFYPTTPQTTFQESGEHPLAETNHSCFVLRNAY